VHILGEPVRGLLCGHYLATTFSENKKIRQTNNKQNEQFFKNDRQEKTNEKTLEKHNKQNKCRLAECVVCGRAEEKTSDKRLHLSSHRERPSDGKKRRECRRPLDLLPMICESEEEERLENENVFSLPCGVGVSSSLTHDSVANTRPCVALITLAVSDETTAEDTTQEEEEREEKIYPTGLVAQTKPEKVELILDSGASEFMLTNADLVSSLGGRKTKIITAQGNGGGEKFSGTFGTPRTFLFPDGTEIHLKRAVVSEGLTENLASVGRLCEAGFSVLFEEGRYRVFKSGLVVKGECAHSQPRDPRTGLYPLTLTLQTDCSSELPLSLTKGEVGVAEVRLYLTRFVDWAIQTYHVDSKHFFVGETETHIISDEKKDILSQELVQSCLAKFYVRENMSKYEKWHGKLGHVGAKAL